MYLSIFHYYMQFRVCTGVLECTPHSCMCTCGCLCVPRMYAIWLRVLYVNRHLSPHTPCWGDLHPCPLHRSLGTLRCGFARACDRYCSLSWIHLSHILLSKGHPWSARHTDAQAEMQPQSPWLPGVERGQICANWCEWRWGTQLQVHVLLKGKGSHYTAFNSPCHPTGATRTQCLWLSSVTMGRGLYWQLGGGDWGCCCIPYDAMDRPPTTETCPTPKCQQRQGWAKMWMRTALRGTLRKKEPLPGSWFLWVTS
jgi:hypothetical protein